MECDTGDSAWMENKWARMGTGKWEGFALGLGKVGMEWGEKVVREGEYYD